MPWEPIHKSSQTWSVPPNLLDYDQTCAAFSWAAVRSNLDGLPGGRGLNIAHEAVDRHANGARRDHLALRWLGKDGCVRDFTYGDLQEHSNRFANVLASLGVSRGDRVFALSGSGTTRYSDVVFERGDSFLFGPESVGRPVEILHAGWLTDVLRIPMQAGVRSLNLANAASIVIYEAWRQHGFS